MSDASLEIRIMLQSYEQQLLAARRLVRYRAKCRIAAGEDPCDPDPARKRSLYVDKVAKEIFDCLIYTGSENPIIEEIRSELSRVVGIPLKFTYPPGKRLRIVKVGPEGHEVLTEEERSKVRKSIWRITRDKISASMLEEQRVLNDVGGGNADIF